VIGQEPSEKIGFRPLIIYAQAQTGLNLCATLSGLHLLYFYSDRRGLSPALAGLAFFIALVLDAVTDPLVGNISDQARFRSGRRRPFFLTALPMGVCYFLLLYPPELTNGLFAWFLIFYFLQLTARKFYETAYGALMPELTLDYDERTRLSSYRQLCGTAGDISGALLPFGAAYLFGKTVDFTITGVVCAIIVAGGAMIAYGGLRERPDFAARKRMRLGAAVRSAAQNYPFLILLAASTLAVMAIQVPTVLIRFLAKYWVHDENAAARWLIAYFAGSMISYPFWFRITIRFEKKPAFVIALAVNAACSLAFLLCSPADRVALLALMGLSGFAAIGIWVTQMAAAADVIEWDEERTGRRQEGAYGGLMSMAIKIAIAISMVMVGPMMGWIGYVPGVGVISQAGGDDLRMMFAVVPAIIYLLSAIVFLRYPITRDSHRQMRERLAARARSAAAPGTAS
jgi:GPH family glycoside/pentoside/hexuronide:cation symporter